MAKLQNAPFQLLPRPYCEGIVNGLLQKQTPAEFLEDNPRLAGTIQVAVAGSIGNGDHGTITVSHALLPNGSKAFQVIAASAGTLALTELLTLTGTMVAGDVINLLVTHAALPGGSYNLQYVVKSTDTTLTLLAASIAAALNANAVLSDLPLMAASALGVVTIMWTPDIAAPTFAANANGAETITIGGTITLNDVITVVVHDTSLPGGQKSHAYTVLGPDTTTTIATAIKALLLADTDLIAAGIVASSSGAVVTVKSASKTATTYTRTLSGSATETATLAGGPTETPTLSATALDTTVAAAFASKLAALISADPDLQDLEVFATSSGPVISINWPGPVGTRATVTVAVTGGVTLTRSPSNGKVIGGSGPIIPTDDYQCVAPGTIKVLYPGIPEIVDASLLATMVAEGAPII